MNELIRKQRLLAEEKMRKSLTERIYRRNLMASIRAGSVAGQRLSMLLCIMLGCVLIFCGALVCASAYIDAPWLAAMLEMLPVDALLNSVDFQLFIRDEIALCILLAFMGLLFLMTAKAQAARIKVGLMINKKKKELKDSIQLLYGKLQQLDKMEADYQAALRSNAPIPMNTTADMLSIAPMTEWKPQEYAQAKKSLGGFATFLMVCTFAVFASFVVGRYYVDVIDFIYELVPSFDWGREELASQSHQGLETLFVILLTAWVTVCTNDNMQDGVVRLLLLTAMPFVLLFVYCFASMAMITFAPVLPFPAQVAIIIGGMVLLMIVSGIIAHRKAKKRKAEAIDVQAQMERVRALTKENQAIQNDANKHQKMLGNWVASQEEAMQLKNEVKQLKNKLQKTEEKSEKSKADEAAAPWLSIGLEECNHLAFQMRKRFPNENTASFMNFLPKGRYPDFSDEELARIWNAYYDTLVVQIGIHRKQLDEGDFQGVQLVIKDMKAAADKAVQNEAAQIKNQENK